MSFFRHATLLPILLAVAGFVRADEPTEDELVTEAREYARVEAGKLAFELGTEEGGPKLERRAKSILQWSNPVSGKVYGDVYVWTHEGRPEVVASIFKWYVPHRHLNIELQSMSLDPVRATYEDTVIWRPTEPGISFESIPDAGAAAPTRAARLLQMRRFAKAFSAEAFDRENEASTWMLRLLGRPILRYASPKRGVTDGAIFAFVQDTTSNPEVLLLIELRRGTNGDEWQYALCRQNSLRFRVTYAGKAVWDVPRIAPPWSNVQRPENPYKSHRVEVEP